MIHDSKYFRVLALAPSTRGFGFAVLEGGVTLVDWGATSAERDKNIKCLEKVKEILAHYRPSVVVLEDPSDGSRRSDRIRGLCAQIVELALLENVKAKLISRKQVNRAFFNDGEGTKHARAEIIAKRFPAELALRLPPKRQAWMSEDYRMDIFDAVALGLAVHWPPERLLTQEEAAR